MLTALNQSIVTAYETCGATLEEIATTFPDIELLAIKATLLQFSPKYRDDVKKAAKSESPDSAHEFTDTDAVEALSVMRRLMHEAEDQNLQYRCAKYIRDDKKGRLDVMNGLRSLNVNVAIFNQRLKEAKAAKELSKSGEQTKQIEEAIEV